MGFRRSPLGYPKVFSSYLILQNFTFIIILILLLGILEIPIFREITSEMLPAPTGDIYKQFIHLIMNGESFLLKFLDEVLEKGVLSPLRM